MQAVYNRRRMLMAMDRRNKLLAYLRRVRYDVFENTCKQLNIQYTPRPAYSRRVTKRWVVKKAFCVKVWSEPERKLYSWSRKSLVVEDATETDS